MRFRLFSLIAAALITVTGCTTPSGGLFRGPKSNLTYQSKEERPVTVTMVDTRTGETFFALDVPAGKQLVINFGEGNGTDPAVNPDTLRWDVSELGDKMAGSLRNTISCPPAEARRIDVDYRDPERAVAPPMVYRTDEMNTRHDGWSERGGDPPIGDRGVSNYDG